MSPEPTHSCAQKTDLEVKFTALDLAPTIVEDGTFEGYASLFNRRDSGDDVVLKGAFRETLKARGTQGIKMLFQHDANQPIGVWSSIKEDARGLFVRGKLMLDVARSREVLALMRSGALDGLSIGFRAVHGHRDRTTGIRQLKKIDLWEISVVTFPMHPEARIASVKSQPFVGAPPTERSFERWLTRDAGLTRSEARAISRSGLKGLHALRDARGGTSDEARLIERLRAATELVRRSL